MKEEFTTSARRWYDKDPVLSSAMKTLEESNDDTQIKIALNLIKIITEHNIEDSKYEEVTDIINATEIDLATQKRNRWYDLDETLRTAISMLQNCPEETRKAIAVEMAKMVVEEIKKSEEEEEEEEPDKKIDEE
ncbi:MAG: hypothetical protein NC200_07105, partial [Candidatus Gastranaerophilales bacterium]|nr:hypothetical protein [Candidatus Gastranaerophilales bacterium]